MSRVSSPASGLAAYLADRTGLAPEPDSVADLYEAIGAYTGLGSANPLTAEIVGVAVAAAAAAMLIERPPSGGTVPHRAPPRDLAAGSRTWPDLTGEGLARLTGRTNHPDAARLSLARMPVLPTEGQMCAVFAVDIVGFTRSDRDDEIRRYLHEKLYEYLQIAFDRSGIPWQDCFSEDRGDGALIVVPPGISFKGLTHPLPEKLRGLIRRHNHVSRESAVHPTPRRGPHRPGGIRRPRLCRLRCQLRVPHAGSAVSQTHTGCFWCRTVPRSLRLCLPQPRLPLPQPGPPGYLPERKVPSQEHQRPGLGIPTRRIILTLTLRPSTSWTVFCGQVPKLDVTLPGCFQLWVAG